MSTPHDVREYAPATERNRQPILEILQRVLPPTGVVLEVASGTGQHAIFFAPRLTPRMWLPSDPNPLHRASIAAWQAEEASDKLYPPLALDVRESVWPVEANPAEPELSAITAIVNINMIHIAPWSACLGLIAGADRILGQQGILYLYGPFKQDGQHTAPSNAAFDDSLQASNPEWGVRNLEEVIEVAQSHNLRWLETVQMPANNLSVIFQHL